MNAVGPIIFFAIVVGVPAILMTLFIRDQRRQLRGYDNFARSMRAMRDWERKNFPGEPSTALRPFKDVFSDRGGLGA